MYTIYIYIYLFIYNCKTCDPWAIIATVPLSKIHPYASLDLLVCFSVSILFLNLAHPLDRCPIEVHLWSSSCGRSTLAGRPTGSGKLPGYVQDSFEMMNTYTMCIHLSPCYTNFLILLQVLEKHVIQCWFHFWFLPPLCAFPPFPSHLAFCTGRGLRSFCDQTPKRRTKRPV